MTTRRFRRDEETPEGGGAEGGEPPAEIRTRPPTRTGAAAGGKKGGGGSAIVKFVAGLLGTVAVFGAFYGQQADLVMGLKANAGVMALVAGGVTLAAAAIFAGLLALAARGGFEAFCLGLLVPAGLFAANLPAFEDAAPPAADKPESGKKKSSGGIPMRAVSLVACPVSSAVLHERERLAGATEKAVADAVAKAKAEDAKERDVALAEARAEADAAKQKIEKDLGDALAAARTEADVAKSRAEGLAKTLEETQQKLAATEEADRKIRGEIEQERDDLAGKLSVASGRATDRDKFEAQAKDLAAKLAEATVRVPILERDLGDYKAYARWVETDIFSAPASGFGILSNRIVVKAPEDRRTAARLLRMFGGAAVPLLRKAEQDPDEGVRAAVRETLAAIGK